MVKLALRTQFFPAPGERLAVASPGRLHLGTAWITISRALTDNNQEGKIMQAIRIDRTKPLAEEPRCGHNRYHPDIPAAVEVGEG